MSMEETTDELSILQFLQNLKVKGKSVENFENGLQNLQQQAATKGLEDSEMEMIIDIIMHANLGAVKNVLLMKCLVPIHKVSNRILKSILTWCLSSLDELQLTVSIIIIQWVIGLWEYGLADRKIITMYYDVFFHSMLKKERLERHLAQLLYNLTKPEDVTRRNVTRLLSIYKKYTKKHIMALLSLFKTYKPELVPERIQALNIESVWRPIPEALILALQSAKDRIETQHEQSGTHEYYKWNIINATKISKSQKHLLPSVGYFHMGSSIFKETNAKSIFDIYSINELGKHHFTIDLPCNAVSLLANMAGYHLLTYANFQFQSRFTYNFYNTLRRAFILEKGKFSEIEMDKLLNMTVQFSRYMQQGVLAINLFLEEYLYLNNADHRNRILDLLQWMIFVSTDEIEETLAPHIRCLFFESSLATKCKIIESLRALIINMFVNQGFDECCQQVPAPFLRQGPIESITDIIPVLTKLSENLIVTGLNTHSYNTLLLSEALTFYETLVQLESQSNITWTVAPSAVIYGAFITKSSTFLSRVCSLLLRYYKMARQPILRNLPDIEEKIRTVSTFVHEIIAALWHDRAFNSRRKGSYLKPLLVEYNLNSLLSIRNHYAVLPYKYIINKLFLKDLNIVTNEDAMNMAANYFPAVSEFIEEILQELQQEEEEEEEEEEAEEQQIV